MGEEYAPKLIPCEDDLYKWCGSFIRGKIRISFSHFTVQEYLTTEQSEIGIDETEVRSFFHIHRDVARFLITKNYTRSIVLYKLGSASLKSIQERQGIFEFLYE